MSIYIKTTFINVFYKYKEIKKNILYNKMFFFLNIYKVMIYLDICL